MRQANAAWMSDITQQRVGYMHVYRAPLGLLNMRSQAWCCMLTARVCL